MNCAPRREDLEAISRSEPVQLLEEERLRKEIAELRAKIERVPFIDTFDLRYKITKNGRSLPAAVMFCLMDVSGSMDRATKDMAKRFYILLYLFLSRTYKNVDVVYIRHHTRAKEVDEHEFFYSQETGGTIVSSALKLMDEVVQARYDPAQWNIYAAGRRMATTGPMTPRCATNCWRRKFCRWCVITAISKLPAGRIRPCGASMNTCRRPLIISPCSIFATRRISTRYSANCFTSSHLKVKLN